MNPITFTRSELAVTFRHMKHVVSVRGWHLCAGDEDWQAACTCGWLGSIRDHSSTALGDALSHENPGRTAVRVTPPRPVCGSGEAARNRGRHFDPQPDLLRIKLLREPAVRI